MARDPQPEGLITFHEAFGVLCDTYPMVAQDKLRRRMHQACKDGALKGFVLLPGIPTRFVVSPAMWSDGAFPDRVFLTEDISEQATGAWAAYAGRTAFVDNGEFRRWLDNSTPATAVKRAGYLTVDQALNWILWGDHTGDTMQLLIASTMGGEADRPRVSFPGAAAMLLEMLVSGDAPAVTSVVGTGEVRPVERAAFVGGEVQHNGEAGGHVIRVLQTSGQERFHAMTRGYHNLLRIEAAPFAAAVERRFAYPPEPIPTCIQLDREQEFTPWAVAALWVGNRCKDGPTPLDAFETGTEAMLGHLFAGRLVARGRYFANSPTEDGHGYSRAVDAKFWEGAVLVEAPEESPKSPRVFLHRDGESFAVALYLPSRADPAWENLEIETAGLIGIAAQSHPDAWVPLYEASGKYTAKPLSVLKFQKRIEDGEGPAGTREEEAQAIADWLNDPSGIPRERGWVNSSMTETSARTVEEHIREAFATYETTRIMRAREAS